MEERVVVAPRSSARWRVLPLVLVVTITMAIALVGVGPTTAGAQGSSGDIVLELIPGDLEPADVCGTATTAVETGGLFEGNDESFIVACEGMLTLATELNGNSFSGEFQTNWVNIVPSPDIDPLLFGDTIQSICYRGNASGTWDESTGELTMNATVTMLLVWFNKSSGPCDAADAQCVSADNELQLTTENPQPGSNEVRLTDPDVEYTGWEGTEDPIDLAISDGNEPEGLLGTVQFPSCDWSTTDPGATVTIGEQTLPLDDAFSQSQLNEVFCGDPQATCQFPLPFLGPTRGPGIAVLDYSVTVVAPQPTTPPAATTPLPATQPRLTG